MALEAAHCRAAAALFPRSEFLARSMVEDYGCDPGRITIVPAAPKYDPVPLEGRSWGSRRALFVGYDFARKGGPELLAAWPSVRQRVPDATLRVVGPPKAEWPIPEGVEWLGRLRDDDALAELYLTSDVFVMPSRYEPWGLTFQEAMAHGTACVSGDFGAQPEVVRDGVSGLNVPTPDPTALAEALVAILADEDLAERLGAAAGPRSTSTRPGPGRGRIASRLAEIAAPNWTSSRSLGGRGWRQAGDSVPQRQHDPVLVGLVRCGYSGSVSSVRAASSLRGSDSALSA